MKEDYESIVRQSELIIGKSRCDIYRFGIFVQKSPSPSQVPKVAACNVPRVFRSAGKRE
jgi:hypothetical protein